MTDIDDIIIHWIAHYGYRGIKYDKNKSALDAVIDYAITDIGKRFYEPPYHDIIGEPEWQKMVMSRMTELYADGRIAIRLLKIPYYQVTLT